MPFSLVTPRSRGVSETPATFAAGLILEHDSRFYVSIEAAGG